MSLSKKKKKMEAREDETGGRKADKEKDGGLGIAETAERDGEERSSE